MTMRPPDILCSSSARPPGNAASKRWPARCSMRIGSMSASGRRARPAFCGTGSPRAVNRGRFPPAGDAGRPKILELRHVSGWHGTCFGSRSEEHTSELQSRENLVCRLLLEKKKHTDAKLVL